MEGKEAAPDAFTMTINGKPVAVSGEAPTTTLLDFLRNHGYTGGKQGCAEGDCGACTVALLDRTADGKRAYRSVNSCIALLPMFAGREIVTVEGLGRGSKAPPGAGAHGPAIRIPVRLLYARFRDVALRSLLPRGLPRRAEAQ